MKAAPFFAAVFPATGLFAAQTFLPEPLPASRYDKMLDGSPFALATKTEAAREKGPGPFANLFVAAIYQLKDSDGKLRDTVTLKSKADQSTFTLTADQGRKDGLQLVRIEWSDKVGASKVSLKKGSEFGTIEFDQANLQIAPQQSPLRNAPTPGGVPVPGIPPINPRPSVRPPTLPRGTPAAAAVPLPR
jgi:hypothetical protein